MKPKLPTQRQAMKSVRKRTIFIGKVHGSPKGKRGYDRSKQKQQLRKETFE